MRSLSPPPVSRRAFLNATAALGLGTFDVAVPMQKLSPVTGVNE